MQSIVEREKSEHQDRLANQGQTRQVVHEFSRKEQLIAQLVRSNGAAMAKCKGCRGGR